MNTTIFSIIIEDALTGRGKDGLHVFVQKQGDAGYSPLAEDIAVPGRYYSTSPIGLGNYKVVTSASNSPFAGDAIIVAEHRWHGTEQIGNIVKLFVSEKLTAQGIGPKTIDWTKLTDVVVDAIQDAMTIEDYKNSFVGVGDILTRKNWTTNDIARIQVTGAHQVLATNNQVPGGLEFMKIIDDDNISDIKAYSSAKTEDLIDSIYLRLDTVLRKVGNLIIDRAYKNYLILAEDSSGTSYYTLSNNIEWQVGDRVSISNIGGGTVTLDYLSDGYEVIPHGNLILNSGDSVELIFIGIVSSHPTFLARKFA